MAAQGSAFRIFSCLNAYRSILFNSCRVIVALPNAGVKQSAGDKLTEAEIPPKPPKPLTPYFRFLSEHRSLVKQEHPELKNRDVVKRCAEDWKSVDSTIKERYTELYKKEMEAYSKDYLDYMAKLTDEQKEKLAEIRQKKLHDKKKRLLRKKYRETGRPKRPLGPYFLFIAEKSKERNQKYNELAVLLKDEWKNMSESAKQKYIDHYQETKKEYDEAIKKWQKRMIKEERYDVVSAIVKPNPKKKSTSKTSGKKESVSEKEE